MRAVIVYESMFGNTRAIAEAIGEGIGPGARVVGVADADATTLEGADLLVVGGPTQAWGMSRTSTRKGAPNYVRKPGSGLALEPGADSGPGVRDWLSSLGRPSSPGRIPSLGRLGVRAAGFDTRFKAPAALTGRASRGITRALSRQGLMMVAPPESFLVDKASHLLPGETDRARAWGAHLTTIVGRYGAALI